MNVLLLSAFHGGSHQAWAEGWQRQSRHQIEIVSLPDRFWKWRLHGGALSLADQVRERVVSGARWDRIVVTDMVDLTTFLALTRDLFADTPVLYYAHENQWTYPLPQDPTTGPMRRQHGERDRHYAFINFSSMLAADRVCFNSRFHREEFLAALPAFLNHYPDEKNPDWIERIAAKSEVLSLGIDLARLDLAETKIPVKVSPPKAEEDVPLVLWNQRWEYDKDPGAFFGAWIALAEEGFVFELAVCGENQRLEAGEFDRARRQLGDRIVHWGFAAESLYRELLWRADITLSTSRHEFFGTAICEAMYCRTWTLLPNRLNYPDLVPVALHDRLLYGNDSELLDRARWALTHGEERRVQAEELRRAAGSHDWSERVMDYDRAVSETATGPRSKSESGGAM